MWRCRPSPGSAPRTGRGQRCSAGGPCSAAAGDTACCAELENIFCVICVDFVLVHFTLVLMWYGWRGGRCAGWGPRSGRARRVDGGGQSPQRGGGGGRRGLHLQQTPASRRGHLHRRRLRSRVLPDLGRLVLVLVLGEDVDRDAEVGRGRGW